MTHGVVSVIYVWLQKTMPLVGFPDVGSCKLLQSFKGHETSSLVQVEIEKGLN